MPKKIRTIAKIVPPKLKTFTNNDGGRRTPNTV